MFGICQQGFEHRGEFAGRAGDDAQHLRGRGLLPQRLGKIIGALPQFLEQPGILDCDDGLGGEILDQLDLPIGEQADDLPVNADSADQLIVFEHRYADHRPIAGCNAGDHEWMVLGRYGPDIGDLDHLLRDAEAS